MLNRLSTGGFPSGPTPPLMIERQRGARPRLRLRLLVALLPVIAIAATACLFDDTEEEEFLAYCSDRYGWDRSDSDCECYLEEMREDDIAPKDIVGLIRGDDGVDLRAGLAQERASDRCFR